MSAIREFTISGVGRFVVLLFGLAPMASAFGPQGIGADMTDQAMDQVT